jgi:prepilin-type N-terminal cleavage/methylation domain-containing protein
MINPLNFSSKRNQRGFTLVELIAVLVILGITLAVAVPNYLNLISDADNAAAMQAVAEGKARLNQKFALMLLNEDPDAYEVTEIVKGVDTNAGDFELVFTLSKKNKEIEVKARGIGNGASGQASGKWSISKDES